MIRFCVSFVFAVAAVQAAAFSHQLHLKMKLQCTTCHAAASTSTKVGDNLLPDSKVCSGCHTQGIPAYSPVRIPSHVAKFSHKQHLAMGNVSPIIAAAIDKKTYLSPKIAPDVRAHLNTANACEACHRGMHESTAVTAAALPQMADCLVCHNKIDPPFSCETCHAKDANLMPASHDNKWLDFHSSGKANLDRQSCQVCHGRQFTCRGCH